MKADSVGQLIMTGVPGKELDAETARLFRRVQPGAYILFGRNLESGTQLRKLIDDQRYDQGCRLLEAVVSMLTKMI